MAETVSFRRGGVELELFKSPNLIAVQMRDSSFGEALSGQLARVLQTPSDLRFVTKYPGERAAVYYCPADKRDYVMDRLREEEESVQYCSHLLQRSEKDTIPNSEIGLDNKIFIEFDKEPSVADLRAISREYGVRVIWRAPESPGGAVLELTDDAEMNPLKISNQINENRGMIAEPCLIEPKLGRAVPNDPGFSYQWHLYNRGQFGGEPDADCNAIAAWDYSWGSSEITIALIDDGFDLGHPDFSEPGKVVHPYDASERDRNPQPTYSNDNHGTACAGVALASRGRGVSIGVAPDCRFMPIRHRSRLGDFNEALAFYHAYQNKADVISCSWGPWDAYEDRFWPLPSLTRYVIDICTSHGRQGKGIPILFAAGNGNESVELDGYASYEKVIAVAACTNEDEKAPYSDYGASIWVTAPSNGGTAGIFTTDRRGSAGYHPYSDYTPSFGGTSSATPLVAGVVGLMLSVNPTLGLDEVKDILKDTAVKINEDLVTIHEDVWGKRYTDEYTDGFSEVYGWGKVDAGAAVKAAFDLL